MANHELMKLTAKQVREGGYNKVIIGVGSCECHGDHLPSGTDTLVSHMISMQIADKVDGLLVLPPVTVGYSAHYDSFPFTLTLGYDTVTQVLYDIMESVIRNGINNMFLMNGHDGNIACIEVASRRIKEAYPQARIAALPAWWVVAGELLPNDTFEVWNGLGHAGEGESSICYHLFPQWCQPENATCVVPDRLPDHVDIKWDFSELTNCGTTGDSTVATAEKGAAMEQVLVDCVVKAIRQLDETNWDYRTSTI